MPRLFFITLIGFSVFSCGSEPQPEAPAPVQAEEPVTVVDTMTTIPGTGVPQTDTTRLEQLLKDFPKHWVEVKKRGNNFIYTEYCGMEHPYLLIEKKNSRWEILTVYGQDGESWEVLDMTLNEQTVSNQLIREGQFIVKKITYPDDEIYNAGYFWNVTTNRATFGDFFDPSYSFADHALKKTFIIEKQDCDL